MELVIVKDLRSESAVRNHQLFGKAVFIECGLHDRKKFCYDHHDGDSTYRLAACEMVHQDLLGGRKLPNIIVMNSVRGFDNLLALYILWYRQLARTEATFNFVSTAGLIDRVGPSVVVCANQTTVAVINTAQEMIPFKESELSAEDLHNMALQAISSLHRMVTRPAEIIQYETVQDLGEFLIATTDRPVGATFYNQGYRAYGVFYYQANGNVKWTLARISEDVEEFQLIEAMAELNVLEAAALGVEVENLTAKWGGRGSIGGSPFNVGTVLSVETVTEVLKKHWVG